MGHSDVVQEIITYFESEVRDWSDEKTKTAEVPVVMAAMTTEDFSALADVFDIEIHSINMTLKKKGSAE
jgi:hypothetical protein